MAWFFLMRVDLERYRSYIFGGIPVSLALILSIAIFVFRGRTRRFFGPMVVFSYLMIFLIAAVTVTFGGAYGLEFWTLLVMGVSMFILQTRTWLRRGLVFTSFVIFVGLRLWILYIPEFLPVPYIPVKLFYYVFTTVAMFLILFLAFRFISNQSAQSEKAFIAQRDIADKLLLNVMPQSVAEELKTKGSYAPRHYDAVTVIFTDFVGFTALAASMTPADLVHSLDAMFSSFDAIVKKHGLEKLKTIGDAYMCAAGIPEPTSDHAERAARAALEFKNAIAKKKAESESNGAATWDIRIGMNTGPVVAGIIGSEKFAYDIWGDTVNIASRMESAGEIGKINISATTAALLQSHFAVRSRGLQNAKGLGEIEMFELVDLLVAALPKPR